MEASKESVFPRFSTDLSFDIQQANIFMSNDTPPRALLADSGFTKVVPDTGVHYTIRRRHGDV